MLRRHFTLHMMIMEYSREAKMNLGVEMLLASGMIAWSKFRPDVTGASGLFVWSFALAFN